MTKKQAQLKNKQNQKSKRIISQAIQTLKKSKINKNLKNQVQKQEIDNESPLVEEKLRRGYKFCQNCHQVLHIHKYVCTICGFVHSMKKHKLDVMKNLNKGSPKVIKSLIQCQQFNRIQTKYLTLEAVSKLPIPSPLTTPYPSSFPLSPSSLLPSKTFTPTSVPTFSTFSLSNPITNLTHIITSVENQQLKCMDQLIQLVVFVQCKGKDKIRKEMEMGFLGDQVRNIAIEQQKLMQGKKVTVRAFGLDNFHQIGQKYHGTSRLGFIVVNRKKIPLNNKNTKQQIHQQKNVQFISKHTITLPYHIEKIKAFSNKLAILTGQKQILIINLHARNILENRQPIVITKQEILSSNNIHLISLKNDNFTCIQWLSRHSNNLLSTWQEPLPIYLSTGTLSGSLLIYSVTGLSMPKLYRFCPQIHPQLVTHLSQCPLSSINECIFLSASHNGSIKIHSLQQNQVILIIQASNRKIHQVWWDTAAKYLLVVRDQMLETCYLTCFYSLMGDRNRGDKTKGNNGYQRNQHGQQQVILTDDVDFRLIRNNHYQSAGSILTNSPMICFPVNSKIILMFNSRNGLLKILQSEQLRKTSLKRKKTKKTQSFYSDYKIILPSMTNSPDENQVKIITLCSTQKPHPQRQPTKNLLAYQPSSSSQSQKPIKKPQPIKKIQPQPGIRRSLRVKKINFYGCGLDQEDENINMNRKRKDSDGEFGEKQSQQMGQEQDQEMSNICRTNNRKIQKTIKKMPKVEKQPQQINDLAQDNLKNDFISQFPKFSSILMIPPLQLGQKRKQFICEQQQKQSQQITDQPIDQFTTIFLASYTGHIIRCHLPLQ